MPENGFVARMRLAISAAAARFDMNEIVGLKWESLGLSQDMNRSIRLFNPDMTGLSRAPARDSPWRAINAVEFNDQLAVHMHTICVSDAKAATKGPTPPESSRRENPSRCMG